MVILVENSRSEGVSPLTLAERLDFQTVALSLLYFACSDEARCHVVCCPLERPIRQGTEAFRLPVREELTPSFE